MNEAPTSNGVVISSKEIYSQMQEVATLLHRIEIKLEALEKRLNEEINESKDAHELARDAFELAKDAVDKGIDLEKQVEKIEENQKWIWRTVLGGLLIGAIGLLFTFAQKGLGG